MLTYVKEDKSLVVMVTKADSGSAMSLTVGETKR
jgi:hypothetical protein